MSNSKLWIWAVIGNVVVGYGSLAIHGFTAAAAGSAARNTARFAMLLLFAGFAAPGLRKWFPAFIEPANLIVAYMAAQFVHFAFVINLHMALADGFFLGFQHVAGSVLGFALVAATGFTARAATRAGEKIHTALLYINWLVPLFGYTKYHVWWMHFVLVPVVGALLLRWLPERRANGASAAGA